MQNKTWNVLVKGLNIPGCNTYSDVAPGNAITLIGAHGYIEIAVAINMRRTRASRGLRSHYITLGNFPVTGKAFEVNVALVLKKWFYW